MTKDEVKKLRMNSPESLQFLNNATKFYNLMMMYRCAIREIQTKLEVLDDEFSVENNRNPISFMHYPVFCYNGQFRRGADGTPLTYMLHGHIHKSEDQVLVDRFSTETRAMMRKSAHQETAQPVPCQMINCFCMYSDYTPLTLEEWVECDQRRRDKADR